MFLCMHMFFVLLTISNSAAQSFWRKTNTFQPTTYHTITLSNENEELNFFEEASSLIYSWLSEEERRQLHEELYNEEVRDISELIPELRLLRLLHFIQVKYIRVAEWVDGTLGLLETISFKDPDLVIGDLVFKDADNKDVSLLWLQKKLREAKPQVTFKDFLRQLGLQEEFENYLASSHRGWQE